LTAITTRAAHAAGDGHTYGRAKRLLRGPDTDPRWARPALFGLLALTAFLYLINLSRNGWANDFYSAAVDAGTKSWKAFFFGSFDSSSFITVDKTPASLWVMELSGRIFGVSSWSMLVPQALEGVATVGVLYAAVRRWFGPAAGLIAGLVMALTPVAALMFRFNNPDALLVLLLTVAAYAMVRALENGRSKWLVLAGAVLGFAFLTKMLQAFLVVPGFALAYLLAGPPRLGKRIWQLVLAGAAILVGGGWWVLAAELVPAADRPYFGGSTNNNILQLAIGYNGLGRLTGSETGSIGGGGGGGRGGGGFGGATGITRLFSSEFGGQISWLLPAALICLAGMLWVSRRAVRTDRTRAAALLWGGWLVCTGLVFSYMSGIIHPYYMVALAPAIAVLVGVGAMALWERRLGWFGRGAAAVTVGVTVWWAVELLGRSPSWFPWLRWVIVVAGVAAAGTILAGPWLGSLGSLGSLGRRGDRGHRGGRRLGLAGIPLVCALIAGLTGPAAYAIDTVATTHTGSLPSAGPQGVSFGGPGGGGAGGRGNGGPPGGFGTRGGTGTGGTAGTGRTGAPGGTGGTGTVPGGTGSAGTGAAGGTAGRGTAGGGTGGPGGLSGNTQVSSALVKLLESGASGYTWVAATGGSQEAAPLELATGGEPVMAIGGFNGTDPTPTLAQFKALVAAYKIHYYIGANSQSFGGGRGSSAIASWVASHFTKETIGGTTVYDLSKTASS
jgi:4-amino-4-deoxy-L-arabinose transferase-like glycosyltransferase